MIINAINKGIVIDHIEAGLGIKLFYYLKLDRADFNVALITNAPSEKRGKKDIIKIQNIIDIDYEMLGLIDPNLTINIIEDEVIIKKAKLKLPKKVTDVIKCKNPRCITSIEKYVPHIFSLVNEETAEYKCSYCDEILTSREI